MLKEKRKDSDVGMLKYDFPAAHANISGTASRLVFSATYFFSCSDHPVIFLELVLDCSSLNGVQFPFNNF